MLLSAQPLVQLNNAGSRSGDRWLVRGVDLAVEQGEIVTLIGPNGSGKSTTAKMALALKKPDEGTAIIRKGLRVGYVPQKIEIDWTFPLSVRRLMRLTQNLSDTEVISALEYTGVAHLVGSEVTVLSGGEFQRVLLARALARKPDLLVLDEPIQGVDFNGEIALYELIESIRCETGCGVLLISHDLHMVMAATDRVVCLNGHVCCQGTPQLVAESKEYQALFGSRAAGSMAYYKHDHDHSHLPDGRVLHADGKIADNCTAHDNAKNRANSPNGGADA